jgi:hypothetical protein
MTCEQRVCNVPPMAVTLTALPGIGGRSGILLRIRLPLAEVLRLLTKEISQAKPTRGRAK